MLHSVGTNIPTSKLQGFTGKAISKKPYQGTLYRDMAFVIILIVLSLMCVLVSCAQKL